MPGSRSLTVAALICLTGCGVTSVSPFVTDADLVDEPRLAGSWQDAEGRENAVISAAPAGKGRFEITYTDKEGKVGRFEARLARIGNFRILDLQPAEPLPAANDVYRSMILRAHGALIIDSVTTVLAFRMIQTDSLKAYLKRNPQRIRHTLEDNSVLLTDSTEAVQRFVMELVRQPGYLDEGEVWRRRKP